MSLTVDPNTNRITTSGYAYDANVNLIQTPDGVTYAYDAANRIVSHSGIANRLVYNPSNQRVWDGAYLYYYGVKGELLGQYTPLFESPNGGQLSGIANVYFNGRPIQSLGHGAVVTDRVGSVRANSSSERFNYYPYEREIATFETDNRTKFATYMRDSAGLDYAPHRYYNPIAGRYFSPELYNDPTQPGKWNAYSYVQGDPINFDNPLAARV